MKTNDRNYETNGKTSYYFNVRVAYLQWCATICFKNKRMREIYSSVMELSC
jgi:hypothetical protein